MSKWLRAEEGGEKWRRQRTIENMKTTGKLPKEKRREKINHLAGSSTRKGGQGESLKLNPEKEDKPRGKQVEELLSECSSLPGMKPPGPYTEHKPASF